MEERWTCTSGEVGLEVKMKDGKRAICCSLYGGGRKDREGGAATFDDIDGEGEGGRGIVV